MSEHTPTPQEAFDLLRAGNRRFATEDYSHPNRDLAHRQTLRDGQNPIAVVLACSDSRVPVELVFDAGLGDIFVVRTAGEILGESVLGSVSYAVNSLDVPLVVVLGHEGCGAVEAAAEALARTATIPDDHRRVLIERVAPSIITAQQAGLTEPEEYERQHAQTVATQLVSRMSQLRARVADGRTAIVAARYRLSDSHVEILTTRGVDVAETPA